MATEQLQIGWRERVGFPDLGIPVLRAKIDTGARTSALHAVDIAEFTQDGEDWVRFGAPLTDHGPITRCSAKLVDLRAIKNTSGKPQDRYVVSTTLLLGHRHWKIEVSLADRDNMGFPLILGRTAMRRHRLLVDPGRSYLAGDPAAPIARAFR
jgi:hypothetical protein